MSSSTSSLDLSNSQSLLEISNSQSSLELCSPRSSEDLSSHSDTETSLQYDTDCPTDYETDFSNKVKAEFSGKSESDTDSECSTITEGDCSSSSSESEREDSSSSSSSDELDSNYDKIPNPVIPNSNANVAPVRPPLDGDENADSPFLSLPEHIRLKILNLIPTMERVRYQTVCKRFRFEIRVKCGVVGYVNQTTTWGLTFLRDIICDTIVVGRYNQPKMTPNQLIFKNLIVKYLLFVGPNSVQYMDAFVGRCSNILRMSVCCPVVERPPVPTDPTRRRDYKTWRKMEVIEKFPRKLPNCTELEVCPTGKLPAFTVHYVLGMCNYVALERLAIKISSQVRMDEVRKIHMAVFDLMNRNPQIKEIIINTRLTEKEAKTFLPTNGLRLQNSGKNPKTLNRLNMIRQDREIVSVSRKMQLRQLSLTEEIVDFHTWNTFMLEQNKLEIMQVLHLCYYPSMFHVIYNNKATLTKIGMHCILQYSSSFVQQNMFLDLHAFSDCHNLKELFLCIGGPYYPGETDLTNFKKLPRSLEVLAIRNATFHARDFMNIVGRLPRLKSLGVITYAGTGLQTHNMSSRVLARMLHIRGLNELLLQGFTLTVQGVREVYIMGKLTESLALGQPNTYYIQDTVNPNHNRWLIGGNKDEFLFRLFDNPRLEH